ncbi:MAG TPA: pseudouridine synthase [Candidatus Xenobia bacterium]|jgi:23S rRNA pseudouridine2457 synthase
MGRSLRYFLFNKPFRVLSQFTDASGRETLASYGPFPSDVYPVGRLDADSEGLLLLTNDGQLQHRLLEPRYQHARVYLAQVERVPTAEVLARLAAGVPLDDRDTLPVEVCMLEAEPALPPRDVPIRARKTVPTCWLRLVLREGRNRQVRRMTAVVGHPTLRLVRVAIGPLNLDGLGPGQSRELSAPEAEALCLWAGRSPVVA